MTADIYEKIPAEIQKQSKQYAFDIESTSLNATQVRNKEEIEPSGRVVAIAIANGSVARVFFDTDEKKLLAEWWHWFRETSPALIGYNSNKFDMRFLVLRSVKHGVRMPISFPYNPFTFTTDLMYLLGFGNGTKGRLVDYCTEMGIPCKDNGITGSDVPELWEKKKYAVIKRYCLSDAQATWKLYKKVTECME